MRLLLMVFMNERLNKYKQNTYARWLELKLNLDFNYQCSTICAGTHVVFAKVVRRVLDLMQQVVMI